MTTSIINRRDLDFQVFEVLGAEELTRRSVYADHNKETLVSALDTAQAIAIEKFANHNRLSDINEPQYDGKCARVISEVKEAIATFANAGLLAATHAEELGGMRLPVLVAQACLSLFKSANVATTSYVGLTIANANVIERFGTADQKHRFLGPLLSGRFLGTMALTEPQAGSSLADLATTATRNADGTYAIRGQKIFISGGDHDISENIIHLVLARIAGAPPGVKGISLFIVPKFRVDADGNVGERNDVALAGLIHKLGWRGTTSTMLSIGENNQCVGELVGESGRGLACMFHMMNEARIGVGVGATMLGYRGYLASLEYARERQQGRRIGNKNPLDPQVPIVMHADIRRMLLAQKAYVEGAYGLCLYAAWLVDEQKAGLTEEARVNAGALLDLLTPIVKSWPSRWCLEANSLAIQIHGGYGYTREYPVEQFYRDNRLNMIHEGTHTVQALDLLGRKVFMDGGKGLALLEREVSATIGQADSSEALRMRAQELREAFADTKETIDVLKAVMSQDRERALANATVFLEAVGHTVLAWMWLRQAIVAEQALARADQPSDRAFYLGKLQACHWFFRWELPSTRVQHELLRSLDESVTNMAVDWF